MRKKVKIELVTHLKLKAIKVHAKLHHARESIPITEFGKPSAYHLSRADYDAMQNRMTMLKGIAKGSNSRVILKRIVEGLNIFTLVLKLISIATADPASQTYSVCIEVFIWKT